DVPVQSVVLNQSHVDIYKSYSFQLVATVYPSNATLQSVNWSSANASIATVDSTGYVTGVSYGITTITATAIDGSGVYATCEVNVRPYNLSITAPSYNQDCRHVQFSFSIPAEFRTIVLHISNRSFTIERPGNGEDYDNTVWTPYVGYDRIKVSFVFETNTNNVTWNLQLHLLNATPVDGHETIWLNMYANSHTLDTLSVSGYVFWKSYIKTGLSSGEFIKDIMDDYDIDGFDCDLYNSTTHNAITYNNSTYASTGMMIVKKRGLTIYEVEFLLLYGDVVSNNGIGDGLIDLNDALLVLQHAAGTNTITGDIFLLAADVNNSLDITQSDAQAILNDAMGVEDLYQDYQPLIPDSLYYQTSVQFT
ncbi:MAG: Ig-like domain-containing protein, partial [Paludibacteraceae bacterium]|nr:Ig-like domain-containing protein [Paludibacteraceae bacterium]